MLSNRKIGKVGGRVVLSLVLGLILGRVEPGCSAEVPGSQELKTIDEVWAGFDPRAEPLEVEILKQWEEGGILYKEFYFTGETYDGEKVRVYAMYGAPKSGRNLPAILHIHGGGQTAALAWVQYWNARGYAALTYNWGGHWPGRDKYTHWGKLRCGNHLESAGGQPVFEPNVRASSWYHWALVARRAITCLESQPEVDPNRIGIFGISMGGFLTWMVAGVDNRVKAACAIYGNGWTTYPSFGTHGDPTTAEPTHNIQLWRATMESESYAPRVHCPILYLTSTNDFCGFIDRAYDTLARVNAEKRLAFTPRYTHHIGREQGIDLPLWMDHCLRGGPAWPQLPVVQVKVGEDGVPALTLKADAEADVARVDLYYSLEQSYPVARFWRTAQVERHNAAWTARLPVMNVDQPLFAFANVLYKSGVCLSSNLASGIPADLGPARATDRPSRLIDDFSNGVGDWVHVAAYTDPNETFTLLCRVTGPDGRPGLALNPDRPVRPFHVGTHKVGDPKWKGPQGARFGFKAFCDLPTTLTVTMIENHWRTHAMTYSSVVHLQGSPRWQGFVLKPDQFKTKDGAVLSGWDQVNRLEFSEESQSGMPPVLSQVEWMEPVGLPKASLN